MPVDPEVVESRIAEISQAIKELQRLTSKPYHELTIDEKYSIRYNVIVLVEALVALCIHVAREEYGYTPRSYSNAVSFVAERLAPQCTEDLVALTWIIDDKKVYDAIKEDFNCIEKLLQAVEKRGAQT